MTQRYIAFDVETPNNGNNRMSAIGIAVVQDGRIVDEVYTLVNPEVHFDPFNIAFTGITPDQVVDAPTFPQVWNSVSHLFDSGILMAHNAPFDMSVLSKCLGHYGISWKPMVQYVCTCAMGKVCHPHLENHKLSTMCQHLDIPLNHHHAGSDSHACAALLVDYLGRDLSPAPFIRQYDIVNSRTLRKPKYTRPLSPAE